MCGIVGYAGRREAQPILLEGLARLEYRGYDSAGVATVNASSERSRRAVGRIAELAQVARASARRRGQSASAIRAGRRTATSPMPMPIPHLGGDGDVAVVHNGVIENYDVAQAPAARAGLRLPQPDRHRSHRPPDRVVPRRRPGRRRAQGRQRISRAPTAWPSSARASRISSSAPAWAVRWWSASASTRCSSPATRPPWSATPQRVVYLDDHQMCVLTPDRWEFSTPSCRRSTRRCTRSTWQAGDADKRRLRALHAQGRSSSSPRCSSAPWRAGSTSPKRPPISAASTSTPRNCGQIDRIIMTACGTSYHAALIGEHLFEQFARIPVEVEYASEFRYRNPPIEAQHDRRRHHAIGRDRRHAGGPARIQAQGTARRSASATSSAAASPAKSTAASTCTPGRRSASPAPRRSPPRSPC